MTDARAELNPNTAASASEREKFFMSTGVSIVTTGRRAGKATRLARELSKMPKEFLNLVFMNCPVPTCKGRACLRLSSPYCYKHALLASPELLIGEIVRVNTETEAIHEVISKLTKQIDGLKKRKARKK